MRVGAVTEIVEVTGEAPLIETTNATLGNLVDQRTIESMPLNGRSWDQLALLQTGVVPYSGGSTKSFGGNTTAQKFSVAGSRNYSNSFLLDSTDVNDHGNSTPGGAAGVNLGVDAIREFQVITNSFKAEYGRASGAIVSAVTKSGTNQFHGSLFEFHRNDELDAAEYGFFDDPENDIIARPPFVQNQFGGSVGGPIVRDRTFFMAAYEGLRIRKGTAQAPLTLSADGKNGILGRNADGTPKEVVEISPRARPFVDLYPTANDLESVEQFNNGQGTFITAPVVSTREDYVLGRIDHQINEQHSIFGRYVFDDDIQAIPGSNLGIPGFTETNNSRRQYATFQVNSILTPTVLNSFRIAYNRSAQFRDMLPDTELGPEFTFVPGQAMGLITVSGTDASLSGLGLVNMGTNGMTPRFFIYNLFEYGDDLSVIRGNHTFKFGGSLKRMRDNSLNDTARRGQYRFPNLARFLRAQPDQFTFNAQPGDADYPLAVGDSYRGLRQWFIAVYGQDDWQVSPRLTLNLGLRYETVTNPTEANHLAARLVHITDPAYTIEPEIDSYFDVTKKNFQPRFGFAWQLNDSATTVIRGGTGIFHDQTLPNLYAVNAERYPPYFIQLRRTAGLTFTQADLIGGRVNVAPTVSQVSPIIKTATKYHWNLTVQQQLSQNNIIEIGYVGARSHNLPKFGELNTPNPVILEDGQKCFAYSGGNPLCPEASRARRNTNFAQLRTTEWKYSGFYNAMNFKFTRRITSGGQFQFLYTLSRAMDSASTHATQDYAREPQNSLDPTDPNRDWGKAGFDALHNMAIHYTYPIPFRGEGAMGAVFGGWEVAGITSIVSGSPYLIRVGADTDRDLDGGRADRPDVLPGFSNNPTSGSSAGCQSGSISIEGGPVGRDVESWNKNSRWHDVCAFGISNLGVYGNLGRNTLIGPGRVNFDFSAHKNFQTSENTSVQLRAEFFNIFNRNNLGLPINQGFSGDRQTDYQASSGTISPGDTVTSPRVIQFGLRFEF
jgi:outer membrane receptor protein involved in Fe transport